MIVFVLSSFVFSKYFHLFGKKLRSLKKSNLNTMKSFMVLFLVLSPFFLRAQDWQQLYDQGRLNYTNKNFEEAVKVLEKAKHAAETQYGSTSTRYKATIELLAQAYDATGRFSQSIVLYKGLREQLKSENKTSSPEYANIQRLLGIAYAKSFELSRKEKSMTDAQKEELFLYSLEALKSYVEIRRKSNQTQNPEFASVLRDLARISSAKKSETKNTDAYYNEALTIAKKVIGEKSDFYLETLAEYADFLADRKQFESAAKNFEQHINLCNLVKKPKKDFVDSYAKAAQCYVRLKDKTKSLAAYTNYFAALESAKGIKDKEFIQALDKGIENMSRLGLTVELEKFFLKRLEAQKQITGDQSVEYSDVLERIGSYYISIRRFDLAKSNIEKGLAIDKVKLGEKDPTYLNASDNLGRLYEITGQYEQAEKLFKSNLELRLKFLGETSNDYTFALDSLGQFYKRRNRWVDADSMFSKAMRIRAVTPGKKHAYYGISLANKADIFLNNKQFAEAEKLLRQRHEIFKGHYGEISFESALALYDIGQICLKLNKPDEAMKIFKDCTSLFQSVNHDLADEYLQRTKDGYAQAQTLKGELEKKK